jgi:hypothetical protein
MLALILFPVASDQKQMAREMGGQSEDRMNYRIFGKSFILKIWKS